MERGIEQLFILALIVLATLIDLFARWLRRKQGKDQPAQVDEEPVFVEADDRERRARTRVEPELPPMMQPSVRASIVPSPPAQRSTQPRTMVRPRRRDRARRWLTHPVDARRGIVLMAILGPCRGVDAPYQGRD